VNAFRWHAPSAHTIRGAQALFAAADLGWFSCPQARLQGDAWSAFDRLIHDVLKTKTGTDTPTVADPSAPGVQPMPLRLPPPISRPATVIAGEGDRLVARTSNVETPLRANTRSAVTARPADRVERPVHRLVGRAARIAALTAQDLTGEPNAPAAREPIGALPAGVLPVAAPSAADVTLMTNPLLNPQPVPLAHRARLIDFLENSRVAIKAASAPATSPPASNPSVPVELNTVDWKPALAGREGSTRLVDGLPALQSLLRAAVAESRQRHERTTADTALVPPVAHSVRAATPTVGASLRALTSLDMVAEDMLVDRLCDRLQERLREQALRQFGFTGGLI